jgi:hypothetical protein
MNPGIARPIIKNIAIFGDAHVSKTDKVYLSAYEAAKLLGQNGYTIVDGGGPGVMEAATNGAKEAGGDTLTVTFDPTDAPGFEGKYLGNVPAREIVTTNYIERMFKLMEHGDTFIIFKGGTGTISEFGTAWVLAKLYYGHHKPFILYGDFWPEIIDIFRKNMNIDKYEMSVFEICNSKEEVLAAIKRFEKKLANHDRSKHCTVCEDKAFIL